MKMLLQVLVFTAMCSLIRAQDADTPISALPETVKSTPGELTLFADYSAKQDDGKIPVYLVNRTAESIKLSAQDGDVYLKLETLNEKGQWIRAQSHVFSWCGNSYFYSPILRANHFMKINGYQPKDGLKKKIRFSLYQQSTNLSSNTGDGLASDKDIEIASKDAMTERQKAEQAAPRNR